VRKVPEVLRRGVGKSPVPIHPESVLGQIVAADRRDQERLSASVAEHGPTREAIRLRKLIDDNRIDIYTILASYRARNPRLFGSVARGDAKENSDIDLLVEIADGGTCDLIATSCMADDLSNLLGVKVDVSTTRLFRVSVADDVLSEAVPL